MKVLFGFLLLLISGYCSGLYSQENQNLRKPDYLSAQTGLVFDGYNSLGIRLFFEYQKVIKSNWSYGISFENSRHFSHLVSDIKNELPTNLDLLSLNGYYRLNLIKDKVFWNAGAGIGGVHAYWENNDKIGLALNASLTLNIKLSDRIYFESSPLVFLLPTSRVYFSPMNVRDNHNFYAISFLSLGVKVKL